MAKRAEPPHLGLRLPEELLERIDRAAEAEGRTRSNYVRWLLEKAVPPLGKNGYGPNNGRGA